jgi:four helix bundle protein
MDALIKLEVWKRACRLAVEGYRLLGYCDDRVFRDQLSRSVLSIASNIAEGYGRDSRKERIHFLRIAKSSGNEAWTQLLIGVEASLIPEMPGKALACEVREVTKMIGGLVGYLNRAAN